MRGVLKACAIAALIGACGYRPISQDGLASASAVAVGEITDFTTEGDLGQVAARRLHVRLGTAGSAAEPPTLRGYLRALPDGPAAYESTGPAAAYRTGIELELEIVDVAGRVIWTSGPARRHAIYLRAPVPLETRAARRAALLDALEGAVDDLAERLLIARPGGATG